MTQERNRYLTLAVQSPFVGGEEDVAVWKTQRVIRTGRREEGEGRVAPEGVVSRFGELRNKDFVLITFCERSRAF